MNLHYSLNGIQVLVFSKLWNLGRNLLFSRHKNLSEMVVHGVKPRNSGFMQTLLSLEKSVFWLSNKHMREFLNKIKN